MTEHLSTRLPAWTGAVKPDRVLQTFRRSRIPVKKVFSSGVDIRKVIRAWVRHGGVHTSYPKRKRRVQSGKLVVLWDVSGSMVEYVSLYLPWLYRLTVSSTNVAVFPFGVGVEAVSSILRQPYATAVKEISALPDLWESGTSMGEALQTFVRTYGKTHLHGRTSVLVISDGWDCGKPEDLAKALAQIRNHGATITWMHPLMRTPGFALKTRALMAARPYVSHWLAGGSPEDLLQGKIH